MKKRFFAILMVFALSIGFFACDGENQSEADGATDKGTENNET